MLGRVGGPERRSLREIWEAAPRRDLRDALAANDFGLGCFECGNAAAAGNRESSLAAQFDRFGFDDLPFPALIDFALSDRCNLQCIQCSGTYSSAIRRNREGRAPLEVPYDDQFFDELDEFLPHLERVQFKGGEPFLSREVRRIWDRIWDLGLTPEISVTTNGTVANARALDDAARLGFEMNISVDAVDLDRLAEIRVGVDPAAVWRNIDLFVQATARSGRSVTLSFCLMSVNWDQLHPFLQRCEDLGVYPNIIWVDGPARFNLLMLPTPSLEEVARHFDALPDSGLKDPTTRRTWHDAQRRLAQRIERAHSNQTVAGPAAQAVRINGPRAGFDRPDSLRLNITDEVITSVDEPDWAHWLGASKLIGTGMRDLLAMLPSVSGYSMRSEVESLDQGGHRARFTFETPDGPSVIEGLLVLDSVQHRQGTFVFQQIGT